jgi:hypothetical protein
MQVAERFLSDNCKPLNHMIYGRLVFWKRNATHHILDQRGPNNITKAMHVTASAYSLSYYI